MIKLKALLEKFASQMASHLQLDYYGFGRYGKDGRVTHVSKFDTLKPINKVEKLKTLPGDVLKHLQHADDEVFNNGVGGTRNVLDHFHSLGYGNERVVVSQKIDGAPSVVMGTHPETGKFFVASKSAFNKDPKINYTDKDIDRNHGHAPGLAVKLKALLKHGKKLEIKGIVQGDMLYSESDKETNDGKVGFKPNTIRYSIDAKHPEGKKVARSKIGIALHTEYDKDGKAILNPNIRVNTHPDVYNMSVAVDQDKLKFDKNILIDATRNIGNLMNQIPKSGWDAIGREDIRNHVMTYINSKVRQGDSKYYVAELAEHIQNKMEKEIESVKTEKSKASKQTKLDDMQAHLTKHQDAYQKAFNIQHHIADAKHHIIDKLNHGQTFDHSYENGDVAHPEGYVMVGHHGPLKFVNRNDFSRINFNAGKFQK